VGVVWAEEICNLGEGIYDPGLFLVKIQWLFLRIARHFVGVLHWLEKKDERGWLVELMAKGREGKGCGIREEKSSLV